MESGKEPMIDPFLVAVPQVATSLVYFFSDSENHVVSYNLTTNKLEPVKASGAGLELIMNFTACVQRDERNIYILGGLNAAASSISDSFLHFDPQTLEVTILPPMPVPRYTFSAVIFNDRLYAIGGRSYGTDQEALLKETDCFDFATQKWTKMASMRERRCSLQAFVYRDAIWVLGGYTDRHTRSPVVEFYSTTTNVWTTWNHRLFFGVESGHLAVRGPDKLLSFSGQSILGANNYCHEIDLARGTVLNKASVPSPCSLANIVTAGTYACMFGENDQGVDVFQAYNNTTELWELFHPENITVVTSGFKKASVSAYTLSLPHDPASLVPVTYSPNEVRTSTYLFGTDDEPFIVRVSHDTLEMQTIACPLDLRLKNFQAVCRVDERYVCLTGGANKEQTRVSRYSYILDLFSLTVVECDQSRYARLGGQLQALDGYVYSMGGRGLGANEVSISNKCERLNLGTRRWERIASMNLSRCYFMSSVSKRHIYVAGGFYGKDLALNSLERYDPVTDEWVHLLVHMPCEIESAFSFVDTRTNDWVIVGGRSNTEVVDSIMTCNLTEGKMLNQFEIKNVLVEPRHKHKGFFTDKYVVVLGGTENFPRFCEVLDRTNFAHLDEQSDKLLSTLGATFSKLNFNGNALMPLSCTTN